MRKFIVFLTLIILVGGCGDKEDIKRISLSQIQPETVEPRQDKIPFAVGSMISPRETFIYYKYLLDYVSEKIGKPVELVQRESYGELNELLKQKKIDLAFVCSRPYVILHDELAMEILVIPQVAGKRTYQSYVIVNKDSSLEEFDDLKGKSFGFSDPLSNSGCLVPTFMLAKRGATPPTFFKSYIWTGSHDNSIRLVAEKVIEAAAVDSLIWEYFNTTNPEFTSQTRILVKSPPYGIPPVIIQRDFNPELKERLREIFLNMDKEERGKDILKRLHIDRFVLGNDRDYDSIREMRSYLEVSPFTPYHRKPRL